MNEYLDINIIEDEIISIEEYDIIDTIDIEVESKNRLFFANDILTHNSGWEAEDLNITNVSESAALIHTVDMLFGIITSPEMKARSEYYLKCLANRVAGFENTRKRFTIDWKYARIEEDKNAEIEDMDFLFNSTVAGQAQRRGVKTQFKNTKNNISGNTSVSIDPDKLDSIGNEKKGGGLF